MTRTQKIRPLLEIRNLQIAYGTKGTFRRQEPTPAVWDVSFTLAEGETLALVGESGSGKTTIARAIAGLMVPRQGQILFEDQDITLPIEQRSRKLHRQIQYIFQNPDTSLNPRRKITYNLGRPLEIFFGLSGGEKKRRMEQLLHSVHLDTNYMYRFPSQLSGGEAQRVAIAQALAAEPKLMLCDEVISALDVSVQANILDLLRELQAERGFAYLFIAHDLAVVRWLAHRVIVLYQGRIMEAGTPEEIFSPPYHPYTEMLLQSVPEPDPSRSFLKATESVSDYIDVEPEMGCPFTPRCPHRIESVCDQEMPAWQEISPAHSVWCHVPVTELAQKQAVS
jgi:peptide/nickel transport system ATP-binding protein